MVIEKIKEVIKRISEDSKTKNITVVSHYDTDGITSAAIFSRAMQRWDKKFSMQIVKSLDKEFIEKLPSDNLIIFLDLGSGSLEYLKDKSYDVIILDHHEIVKEIPKNVFMVNPLLEKEDDCSGAALAYLFARELSENNRDLAHLAIIGMIGDMFEDRKGKIYDMILKEAEVTIKRGLMLYPSTRPLDKALEYSSGLYIPGVTGSFKGVMELLKEAGLEKGPQGYKTLLELTDEEMSRLITSVMLRRIGEETTKDVVGNIYLTKFFNKIEDIREISATINACSRMGSPEVALAMALGNKNARKEAYDIYTKYKQNISSALKFISETEKIEGKNYTIINAQDKIKDTIIGTAASIMSFSPLYPKGTVIIAMAYDENKIKVSARLVGRNGRNVRELLNKVVVPLSGEVGGHPNAAGCVIPKDKEEQFIKEIKSVLEVELVKI